jgi:hypothetical protein
MGVGYLMAGFHGRIEKDYVTSYQYAQQQMQEPLVECDDSPTPDVVLKPTI